MDFQEIIISSLYSFASLLPTSVDYFYSNAYTLLFITLSITAYAILIYQFYHFLSRRDVFGIKKVQPFQTETILSTIWNGIQAIIHYGGIFPFFVFIWFAGFSVLLSLIAKNLAPEQLLLVSVTFVGAIRITAYFTEDLSKDLAKLIPLVLLSVALVEPGFFSQILFEEKIKAISQLLPQSLSFLVFIVVLEWVLRILLHVKMAVFGTNQEPSKS